MFAPQILHKQLLWNALGRCAYSQEYFTTIVHAKPGGQTECIMGNWKIENRPFPSSLLPLFQTESKCETFHMKMSSARSFFFMEIKVIFIRMVSHLNSLWNRGTRELGDGLLEMGIECFEIGEKITKTHINFDRVNQMTSCCLNFKSFLGQSAIF